MKKFNWQAFCGYGILSSLLFGTIAAVMGSAVGVTLQLVMLCVYLFGYVYTAKTH